MKRILMVTAALVAAVAVWIAFTIPPHRQALPVFDAGTVPGVVHIHTNRSDGLSGPDEIAAAAARAGLKFVVLTDHGDATRTPAPPIYRSGVLCLEGVEISTNGGHYLALDMPASPYPLAGEARDVVEDVRRLGGFGIVAHPDSPKPQLQWRDWTTRFDGVELLNPDTSWRVLAAQPGWSAKLRLLNGLLGYAFRPVESMAAMIQPTGVLLQWEALAERRRVVVMAGADAHARLALRSGAELAQGRYVLPLPGYESSFELLSIRVRPEAPLSGDAVTDGRLIMRAIRAGHLHTVIDGLASPAAFEFSATNEHGTVHEGDEISAAGSLALHVRTNAPPDFTTVIHEGIRTLAAQRGAEDWTVHATGEPAVFWVEILSGGRPTPVTWLRSNPIYVRGDRPTEGEPIHAASDPVSRPLFDGASPLGWAVEHDADSQASVNVTSIGGGKELEWAYRLADTPGTRQTAVLVVDTPDGIAQFNRLSFTVRSDHPMRVSVQFRGGIGPGPEDRWQRSVFVDRSTQVRSVNFDDVTPVGPTRTVAPPLEQIRNILFVVDRTNAKAADAGHLWITRAELQH
ncbi:MAG TPA: hypothetical protein VGG73_05625 [Vicinamibacterales bacterium]